TALTAGDLTLNGFQVGASSAGLAAGQSTASAFSVAAAINAISPSSGVTAVANANTVAGGAITSFVAGTGVGTGNIGAGAFSINGVNVGDIQGGASAAGQGANVAAAINKIANQTGVTATANATDGTLTLNAADGRDISIAINGAAAGATAGDQTTAADLAKTTLMAQTGLASGVVGTQAKAGLALSAPVPATTGALGIFTPVGLVLGVGGSSLVTQIHLESASSFLDFNDFKANTLTATTASMAAAIDAIFAGGNNTTDSGFTINYGGQATSDLALSVGTLSFSRADGENFTTVVAAFGLGTSSTPSFASATSPTTDGRVAVVVPVVAVAATAAANHGTVTMTSTSSNGIVYGGAHADRAGLLAAGDTVQANTTSSVSSIASMNVLTAENATKALSAIDGALGTVNASRAALGAIQNRFTSVVTSLQTTSENLSSSRSRIQDADFAAETAALSRAQVLQQAGTAMVAQANQLPQGVLALLR
ncbi:MAG: flagellin, partial [Rhodoferax sp.]|uniref:flagellin n=1 Tax=Rhodoferax sp. TaxID=50421 RepID=UPI003015988A